ncbi:hypothetical protein QMQ05_10645 [Glutamicibacter ectropisis]|uniref:IS30 family transposase n=1 Tax=Glutamicibacter ectropisis TaxID=3046593 RepID=A0AAU6WA35_9MICC
MRTRSTLTEGQRERLVDLFEAGMGAAVAASELNVRYYATEKL